MTDSTDKPTLSDMIDDLAARVNKVQGATALPEDSLPTPAEANALLISSGWARNRRHAYLRARGIGQLRSEALLNWAEGPVRHAPQSVGSLIPQPDPDMTTLAGECAKRTADAMLGRIGHRECDAARDALLAERIADRARLEAQAVTIDALRAELERLRDEPMFASDATKDVDYWRIKASEHYTAFQGCETERLQLERKYTVLEGERNALRANLAQIVYGQEWTAGFDAGQEVGKRTCEGLHAEIARLDMERAVEIKRKADGAGDPNDPLVLGLARDVDELEGELTLVRSAAHKVCIAYLSEDQHADRDEEVQLMHELAELVGVQHSNAPLNAGGPCKVCGGVDRCTPECET